MDQQNPQETTPTPETMVESLRSELYKHVPGPAYLAIKAGKRLKEIERIQEYEGPKHLGNGLNEEKATLLISLQQFWGNQLMNEFLGVISEPVMVEPKPSEN